MLPFSHRLRQEKEIKTLFTKGKSVFSDVCGLKFKRNELEKSRFAVVVGSKTSKRAVVRNRLRRILQDELKSLLPSLLAGFDVIVLVRPQATKVTPNELREALHFGLKKAGIFIEYAEKS